MATKTALPLETMPGHHLPSPRRKTPKSKFINSLQSPEHTPTTTASTPSPSSSPRLQSEFYAIRKGRGVENCIFTTWDHAKEHVGNFKEAVYNVFDKMEDALLYIRPNAKANSANINKTGTQNRKRTAVLPVSTSINNKKPRTVSILQSSMPPARKVSLCVTSNDKENNEPQRQQSQGQLQKVAPNKQKQVAESTPDDDVVVEDGRPLPKILEEGYKNSYVKGWRANALFPQKKQCR